ncbi:hypothetical protein VFSR5_1193, partial [Aliivibrio fischeri SR5]
MISLERASQLLGITRQCIYQQERRALKRAVELSSVKNMVQEIRRYMPRIGGK